MSPLLVEGDTGRRCLASFIDACNELYDLINQESTTDSRQQFLPAAERILDCLDLSGLPSELRDSSGVESAVFLKETLLQGWAFQNTWFPDGSTGSRCRVCANCKRLFS